MLQSFLFLRSKTAKAYDFHFLSIISFIFVFILKVDKIKLRSVRLFRMIVLNTSRAQSRDNKVLFLDDIHGWRDETWFMIPGIKVYIFRVFHVRSYRIFSLIACIWDHEHMGHLDAPWIIPQVASRLYLVGGGQAGRQLGCCWSNSGTSAW